MAVTLWPITLPAIANFLWPDLIWVLAPVLLLAFLYHTWHYFIIRVFWKKIPWVVLEITPPKIVERSPKIAEQMFAGIFGLLGDATKYDMIFKGKRPDYVSFEIAGNGGQVHFYIRVPEPARNLIESVVYAQYPEAEIKLVDDYVKSVPDDLPNKDFDIWGTTMKFLKGEAYPIRTHIEFQDEPEKIESYIDPIAILIENLGKLKPGEQIWLQFLVKPMNIKQWRNKAMEEVNKLMSRPGKPVAPSWLIEKMYNFFDELGTWFNLPSVRGSAPVPEQRDPTLERLSPGERDVLAAVERKMAKLGFDCAIRWVYLGPRDIFSKLNVAAVMGYFNQVNTNNLNTIVPGPYITKANYLFKRAREDYKKRMMMFLVKKRPFWDRGHVLNIEELATFYHFPTESVFAPSRPRTMAKKGTPPPTLPVQ